MGLKNVVIGSIWVASALSLANAAFTFKNTYPTPWAIPKSDPQVQTWMKSINQDIVPKLQIHAMNKDGSPVIPKNLEKDACYWTNDLCINKDITVCPQVGVFGLTFDDGPTEFSPTLYDFLDKTNTKATLFVIGSNVVAHPDILKRACDSGHQIAVHTWSHHPSTCLTNEQFVAEVKFTELAIQEICGITPRYFRPPYGDIDNRIRALLDQMGYISVIWDLDTNDWQLPPGGKATPASVDAAFSQWIAARPKDTTGHVCLEHDLYNLTVAAAMRNLPLLQKVWNTVPVATCMNDPYPYREPGLAPFPTLNGTVSQNATSVVPSSSSVVPSSSSAMVATSATVDQEASTKTQPPSTSPDIHAAAMVSSPVATPTRSGSSKTSVVGFITIFASFFLPAIFIF